MRPHGIKGEVKVKVHTDFKSFEKGNEVIINNKNYVIETSRSQNELLLVKFELINNRNDADLIKGLEIFTKDGGELLEGEYHLTDLIGLVVYEDDNLIGEVTDVLDVPQGHVLVLKGQINPRILIPFIDQFIIEVLEDKILVKLPEGLI